MEFEDIFSAQGKKQAGLVLGSEAKPFKSDIEAFKIYQENECLAKVLNFTSHGDEPLRATQLAQSRSDMWGKLNVCFTVNTKDSMIGVLSALLNSRLDSGK